MSPKGYLDGTYRFQAIVIPSEIKGYKNGTLG